MLTFTASAATTGSNTFVGNQVVTGSLTVTGSITTPGILTAQTLVVQTITSSVDFVTGSTRFGSVIGNTHVFTGSLLISGSVGIGTNTPDIFSRGFSGNTLGFSSNGETGVELNSSVGNGAYLDMGAGGTRIFTIRANTTNTNLSTTTGSMSFTVSGSDRIFISSSGNVGIGTTSPSTLFQTNQAGSTGYFYSGQQSGTEIAYWYYSATEVQFSSKSATRGLALMTNDTTRLFISASGNVGIGTNSPSNKLTISNNGNSVIAFRINDTNANGSFLSLNASNTDSAIIAGGTSAIPFDIYTSGSVRMRIETDGSMGFNNSIVGSRSFVFKGVTSRPIVIEAIENAGVHSMFFRPNNSGYNLISSNYLSGGTYLPLSLSARENNNDLVLATNGYVSIGSTSAAYNFNVYGASGADGWGGFFGGAGATKGGIYLGNAGNQYGSLHFDNATNNVVLKQAYASGTVNVIANTGGVTLANGGTSWAAISSDIRKKKNFEIVPGLDAILQIEPVKYHFEWDDDSIPKRLGFKAQNIQPLIPEMVLETGEFAEDGSPYLTVTPDYILPVLVKAIQELQAQINELKNN
jgi:hypothetical protein